MRRSRDAVLMDCAYAFSARSTCNRGQYGAVGTVIAFEGRILSTGYNGAPAGTAHCDHTCTCPPLVGDAQQRETAADRLSVHRDRCPADTPCLNTVHAETNAITYAARHGTRIDGATLYTTVSPCLPCALIIVNAGLVRVVYGVQYRDPLGMNFLVEAKVETLRVDW